MNIGKSLKFALLKNDKNQSELAQQLGLRDQQISRLANAKSANGKTIEMLANAFDMSVSEFIALGE